MIRRLASFWRLDGGTRTLIVEAGAALMVGAALAVMPLRWYAGWLGRNGVDGPADLAPDATGSARRIGWAIRLIAGRVPFRSDCLPQAIAARIMLARRGLPVTVYFGTRFTPDRAGLTAHAWSRCGAVTLTGNAARRGYAVVGTFTRMPDQH